MSSWQDPSGDFMCPFRKGEPCEDGSDCAAMGCPYDPKHFEEPVEEEADG